MRSTPGGIGVSALRHRLVVLGALLALVVAGCGGGTDSGDNGAEKPTVVATTTILGDLVSNIVGDDAEVVVLMPVGADPHDFQASAAQVATMNRADLVVANGLFLEEGLEDVLAAVAGDGVNVLEVGPLLDPLPFGEGDDHDEEEGHDHEDASEEGHDHEEVSEEGDHDEGDASEEGHDHEEASEEGDHDEGDASEEGHDHEEASEEGHEHGSDDPHLWFDPIRMGEAARQVAAELAMLEPSVDWAARAEAYADELAAADETIAATLAAIPAENRRLVTNHGAFGYFAARYDFEIVGTVIPTGSTLSDPSSEELANLVATMEAENMSVIFSETIEPDELAQAVAGELGTDVSVVSLYTGSLGEPGSGADTLIGLLTTNAELIAEALGG